MSGGEEIQRWGPAEIISGEPHVGPDGRAVVMREVARGEPFPSIPFGPLPIEGTLVRCEVRMRPAP